MKGFPPRIRALLITSLVLTIGRGLSLPFVALYLAKQNGLAPQQIGLVLGAALTLGILFSLYGGYLVDRFAKDVLFICAILLFSLCFLLFPLVSGLAPMIVLLALVNCAYAQFSITLKASIAEWLTVEKRIKAFSANYTLVNVGWAIGPPAGVALAGYSMALPFYLAGALAAAVSLALALLLPRYGQPPVLQDSVPVAAEKLRFRQILAILRQDKPLILFTLGGALGSLVSNQFASCISQYLMVAFDTDFAYRVVGIILPVNAAVVITLQYLISRRIRRETLMTWLVLGTLLFFIGLMGFALSGASIPLWVVSVALFSLGEIIITPVEYLVIDYIAPPQLKGSYYGMQNLGNLGGAANPLLTGVVLAYLPPVTLFPLLALAALASLWLFRAGFRHGRAGPVKPEGAGSLSE